MRENSTKSTFVLEGTVQCPEKIDFKKSNLSVQAFIQDEKVAESRVDGEGTYKLTFSHEGIPPYTQLCLVPGESRQFTSYTPVLDETINPHRFKPGEHNIYRAIFNFTIPESILGILKTVTVTHHIHGTVGSFRYPPLFIKSLPGVKIEFYCITAVYLRGKEIDRHKTSWGSAETDRDGKYDFTHTYSYTRDIEDILGPINFGFSSKQGIQARIYQFIDGAWKFIYESSIDWNFPTEFKRNYFVPYEDIIPVLDAGLKPDEGFRFISVGLLPIDTHRISGGYATAEPGDPVYGIRHQPFCGTLRIFGLFAETEPVASYTVQIADVDEEGNATNWRDVTDALYNREWNDADKKWRTILLGPDPENNHYRNIDGEPEINWHEHALKVTWNSANEPDGLYTVRIIGYDTHGDEVGRHEMPALHIDNSPPDGHFCVLGTVDDTGSIIENVSPCGGIPLPVAGGKIRFKVTAYDNEGHLLRYILSGTRGKESQSAGNAIMGERDPDSITWNGIQDHDVDFPVDRLPPELRTCDALAYHFDLDVLGSATDGYCVTPESQRIHDDTNLVVFTT